MRKIIAILIFLSEVICVLDSKAQITLPNPSFENDTIASYLVYIPVGWSSCYQNNVALLPEPIPFYQPPPIKGNFYADFAYSPVEMFRRSISSQLSCPTVANASHIFALYLRSFIPPPPSPFPVGYNVKGIVKIWLSIDSCTKGQLIYNTGLLDTIWTKFDIEFIPDNNYRAIYFEVEKGEFTPNSVVAEVLIDGISEITIEVPNIAHITSSNIKGNCYQLQSTIATGIVATRYEWQQGNTVISKQASVNSLCITAPTTIHFTAWDACGYAYVDSVVLINGNFFTALNATETTLQIVMVKQPTESQLIIYNAIGQLISSTTIAANTATFTLPLESLGSGVYLCSLVADGKRNVKRFVKKI